jgi:Tol biopolymer transport system component
MMALRKQPGHRYQTVADLAEDLRRHAQGLPVYARGRSWMDRARKFARRRRLSMGALALVAVAVLAILEAIRQPPPELANRHRWIYAADSVSPDGRLLSFRDWQHAHDLTLHDLRTAGDRRLTKNSGEPSPFITSSSFSRDGRWLAYTVEFLGEDLPKTELRIVSRNGAQERTLFRNTGDDLLLAHDWTDSRHVLLSVDGNSTKLLLVSVTDGSSRQLPVSQGWSGLNRVMVSPDGRYAGYTATQGTNKSSEIRVISLDTGADTPLLAQAADDSVLGWAPDGDRLVFSSNRSGVGGYDIWWVSMANGQAVGTPQRFGPTPDLFQSLGITKQGALFYAASNDSNEVFLAGFDAASGRLSTPRVLSGRFAGTKSAPVWSPDGSTVLFVAADTLHFHTLSTGSERNVRPKLTGPKRVFGLAPGRAIALRICHRTRWKRWSFSDRHRKRRGSPNCGRQNGGRGLVAGWQYSLHPR